MDLAQLKAEWLNFSKRLYPIGMGIFGGTTLKVTEEGSADIRILALMLLARILSNLKAALVLVEGGFIVEAKTIARCCFENSYWVGALVKEGGKFRTSMVQHEMKHKRMRAQTIFSTTAKTDELKTEISDKLRQWMRDHKQYDIFVAIVAFLQWRTAQQRAVLDLFERRHALYEIVRKAVATMARNSNSFDQSREVDFMQAMENAYFFFGDDVVTYLETLWSAIMDVRDVDKELNGLTDPAERKAAIEKRRAGMNRITQFHSVGKPLFANYMRFSQKLKFGR